MALMFAATYPERTLRPRPLRLAPALRARARLPVARAEARVPGHVGAATRRPGAASEMHARARGERPATVTDEAVHRCGAGKRLSASPGAVMQLARMNAEIDVRPILSTIRVPTLVLHRADDHLPIEGARWMAEQIPGARFVALPGGPHFAYAGDWQSVVAADPRLLGTLCRRGPRRVRGGPRHRPLHRPRRLDRDGRRARRPPLARAARAAPRAHPRRARRFRGVELDTAGDGFFARFDGPGARHPLRVRDPRRAGRARPRGACRRAHGRVRGARRQGRPGSPSRSARASQRARAGRGARLVDRPGPRRRLGDRVRGSRRRRAQGRARRVARSTPSRASRRTRPVEPLGDPLRDERRHGDRLPRRRRRPDRPRAHAGRRVERRAPVGSPAVRPVQRAARLLRARHPFRQARHGALRPGPGRSRRSRSGPTTSAPSWTPPARSGR